VQAQQHFEVREFPPKLVVLLPRGACVRQLWPPIGGHVSTARDGDYLSIAVAFDNGQDHLLLERRTAARDGVSLSSDLARA
jgi:hypothetical protein